ncbi:L,D-transpeptidase [Lichenifustis flavocetrariae]|uniref:L,D-transpeptidase n=1 Tax=Lichenifustis flavocetrariae TaxID=2949735 RepID=A0AA41Z0J2_9HYPH|nr:L,D-transpeptidase [Lichenifustis flavocetrariae]MCW6510543.1 L,D-transpeptidase [Lichenifustis flavocetrariae]
MHRSSLALLGAVASVIAFASSAQAYEGSFFLNPPDGGARASAQPDADQTSVDPGSSAPAYATPSYDQTRPMASPIPREVVAYDGPYAPGTIVISTEEKRLYLIMPDHQALRYGVGVGRPGFEWSGVKTITAKREWPDWTPPAAMLRRRPDLPRHMAGGIENPLGARAMYLGSSEYRIHGSNEPDTIGQAVSSGCIRMTNEDVADLYDRVKVGAKAVVAR